jgi:hypothetical protein
MRIIRSTVDLGNGPLCDCYQDQAVRNYGATTFTLNSAEVGCPVAGVPVT